MIKDELRELIQKAAASLNVQVEAATVSLEYPDNPAHGDYSSNIALALGKNTGTLPLTLAVQLVEKMMAAKSESIEKIEVAGPGFINFHLSSAFFQKSISEALQKGAEFGKGTALAGKLVVVEYTDPNPFKQFHIGHLMSNTIGEAISRIVEWNGAEVKRVCYQGDVGMHVALAIWGLRFLDEDMPSDDATLSEKAAFLGRAYAAGSKKSKEENTNNVAVKDELKALNKKIYNRSDAEVNQIYDTGKEWSLEYFEQLYNILGTTFDRYFFESEVADHGKNLVKHHIADGIFEKSDGAVVFKGEQYGLHTRVFVNSEGLPTYEAKELGLADEKFKAFPYDLSIVVTANEVNDYFKVLLKALELIKPELAAKTKHISHGVMKLPTGKMSSRTGDVVTAEALIDELKKESMKKVIESKRTSDGTDTELWNEISEQIAVAAIKYSILKQAIGRDSIFSAEQALSFEGDSGPYLQYAHTRASSLLQKAKDAGIAEKKFDGSSAAQSEKPERLHTLLHRFPDIIDRAGREYAPQYISTYLIELASSFNSYYAEHKIVDAADPASPERVALTHAFEIVIKNGLTVLGIKTPEKM